METTIWGLLIIDNNLKSNIIKSNKIILNRSNARINYDENNINPIDKYLPNKVYFLKQSYTNLVDELKRIYSSKLNIELNDISACLTISSDDYINIFLYNNKDDDPEPLITLVTTLRVGDTYEIVEHYKQ